MAALVSTHNQKISGREEIMLQRNVKTMKLNEASTTRKTRIDRGVMIKEEVLKQIWNHE